MNLFFNVYLLTQKSNDKKINQNDQLINVLFQKISEINQSIERKLLLSESFRKISNKKINIRSWKDF